MKQYFLGIEFGSTRIKAVLLDEKHAIVKSGDYTWKSSLENGVWTYHMEDVQEGLRTAIRNLGELPGKISAMGVSGMMHGYLAFDKDWNLLAPFRTWQNTMTGEAADKLTEAFGFNIPQRWSAAHLYQAVLNGEPHVKNIVSSLGLDEAWWTNITVAAMICLFLVVQSLVLSRKNKNEN